MIYCTSAPVFVDFANLVFIWKFSEPSLVVESVSTPATQTIQNETTLWNFDQAASTTSINEFESNKGGEGMMQMQSIQEEKPYIDSKTTSKEVSGISLPQRCKTGVEESIFY